MSVNSRRSGFVHFFTNRTESFMNSFSGAMAMSATSIFNNEMCLSLFLFPKSLTFFFGKKSIKILHKNQTHLKRRRRRRWWWRRTERGRRRLVCYCCCFCCFLRFFPTRRFTFRRPLMVRFLFKFPREEENRNKFRLRRRREGNRADSRARSDFNLFWRRRVVASFILTLRF